MVAGVQVVVAATAAAVIAGQRHGGDQRFINAPLDDVAEIVDVRHRAGDGAEQENPPVTVLVDEDVVEAARLVRRADAADLARVGHVRAAVTSPGCRVILGEPLCANAAYQAYL